MMRHFVRFFSASTAHTVVPPLRNVLLLVMQEHRLLSQTMTP